MEEENFEEQIDFNEVVDALLDSSVMFPPKYLSRLSGLEDIELEQLTESWPQIPAPHAAAGPDLDMAAGPDAQLDAGAVASQGLGEPGEHQVEVPLGLGFMSDRVQNIDDHLPVSGKIPGA